MRATTNADTVQTIETSKRVGDTDIHKQTTVSSEQVDGKEVGIFKLNQVVWLGIHLIGIVLALRFVFLLLGARVTGFVAVIYSLSLPFVRLFQGIFPAPSMNGSYFDTASLLALAMWYVFGFIVTYIISLFSNQITKSSS